MHENKYCLNQVKVLVLSSIQQPHIQVEVSQCLLQLHTAILLLQLLQAGCVRLLHLTEVS